MDGRLEGDVGAPVIVGRCEVVGFPDGLALGEGDGEPYDGDNVTALGLPGVKRLGESLGEFVRSLIKLGSCEGI
jgi:hypothetical protein